MDFEQIFSIYFHQVTHGCEDLSCDSEYCASSSKFKFKKEKPSLIAMKLTEDHIKDNRICPAMSALVTHPDYLIHVARAHEFLVSYIADAKINQEVIGSSMLFLMQNPDAFSYIFMSDDKDLQPDNLYFDDDVLGQFFEKDNSLKNPVLFSFKITEEIFRKLVLKITNCERYTLRNIRAHICLFFFSSLLKLVDDKVIMSIISSICKFPLKEMNVFLNTLVHCPKILYQITSIAKKLLNKECTPEIRPHSLLLHELTAFIEILSKANSLSKTPIPQSAFFSEKLCTIISPQKEFELIKNGNFSYLNTPSVLTHIFKATLIISETQYMNALNGNRKRNITIRRDHLLEDALNNFKDLSNHQLHEKIHIIFAGSQAQDDGGVSREFMYLLTNELTKPEQQLFIERPSDQTVWFNPKGNNPELYKLFGTIVGLSIINQIILPVRFPPLLYKKLIGQTITESDFAIFDPEIAKSFEDIRAMAENGDNISDLYLDFTINDEDGKQIEIIPGGKDKAVNNDNYEDYIQRYIEFIANKRVENQFSKFAEGYNLVCDTPVVSLLSARDLELYVSGEETYDWEALKESCVYDNYTKDSQSVKDMWRVFDSFDEEKKKCFLRFVTGCDRAPTGGLKQVVIRIQRSADVSLLPTAHTCKSIFVLPDYKDYEKMKQNLLICSENAEGLYLV